MNINALAKTAFLMSFITGCGRSSSEAQKEAATFASYEQVRIQETPAFLVCSPIEKSAQRTYALAQGERAESNALQLIVGETHSFKTTYSALAFTFTADEIRATSGNGDVNFVFRPSTKKGHVTLTSNQIDEDLTCEFSSHREIRKH